MVLSDEVKQFLSIVDGEVGLDVFFTACLQFPNTRRHETDRDVMEHIQQEEYEFCMEDIIDEFIVWEQAEQELMLEEDTFLNLSEKIQMEMS